MGKHPYELEERGSVASINKSTVSYNETLNYRKTANRSSALGTVDEYFVNGKQRLVPVPSSDPLGKNFHIKDIACIVG
jgi:hypothetical protein